MILENGREQIFQKCPECGGNMRKNNGLCHKCKKKQNKETEEKEKYCQNPQCINKHKHEQIKISKMLK